MQWPTGTDYTRAIQNPSSAFGDPTLRRARPATNAMGMPLVASGQNAIVFLLRDEAQSLAVRCFTTPPDEGGQRSAALSSHLAAMGIDTALVSSRWVSQGIRVGQTNWPITVMPWIDGSPLTLAVEEALDDRRALACLADAWVRAVLELQRAEINHGDLQHGNVLVDLSGSFRFVDLDAIWVPNMMVGPPHESGHPNYQHPHRTAAQWARYGDSFSALIIETGLRALAADSRLERFLNGENLLFNQSDLIEADSALWLALAGSPDPEVVRLALLVRARADDPADAAMVPYVELRSGRRASVTARTVDTAPLSNPAAATFSAWAGWYVDPSGQAAMRYWDGWQWTDHRALATGTVEGLVSAAPGWYPDSIDRSRWRFWDGAKWTPHVARDGLVGFDHSFR